MCEAPAKKKEKERKIPKTQLRLQMERFKVLHAEEYMFILGLRPVRESVTLATGEAEARGLRMQDLPGLLNKFKASLCRPVLGL